MPRGCEASARLVGTARFAQIARRCEAPWDAARRREVSGAARDGRRQAGEVGRPVGHAGRPSGMA
eukprot:8646569-Alexandrium_andersonii.AAC.1